MTPDPRSPDRADPQAPSATEVTQTPPIARPGAPEGPDVTGRPEAAPGHYGPGYGDPTRHLGDSAPGREGERPAPAGEPGGVARTDATGANAGRSEGAGGRETKTQR